MPLLPSNLFKRANAYLDKDADDFVPPVIDGVKMGLGLSARDMRTDPRAEGLEEYPDDLLIPEADIKGMLAEQIANHASLFELRERSNGQLDSLNQSHYGLCWAFSSTKAAMYAEAVAGNPITKLSPWYVAGMIKGWRDEGGWGEASTKFLLEQGAPKYESCPDYSKKYATAEVAAEAKKNLLLEAWIGSGDKEKRCHQMVSNFLRGNSGVLDLNWMGHSMSGCRLVSFTSFRKLEVDTDNSWGMGSGVKGLYRLVDSKAMPDDLVMPRVITAAGK